MEIDGCLACDLTYGRQSVPGGRIAETKHWLVEHTVGPLPLGTLIVKPFRHVLSVADLTDDEGVELGPLLPRTASAVRKTTAADQVYVCLWSHAGGRPGHIHFVVQPAWNTDDERYGPALQVAQFAAGETASLDDIAALADRARALLTSP